MKNINKYIYIAFGLMVLAFSIPQAHAEPQSAEILAIYFTPPTGAASGVVRQIDLAKKSVIVMAYGFTSLPIAEALARAVGRGVRVELIEDQKSSTNNRPAISVIQQSGAFVKADGEHAIAHNKVILIDEDIVITGSYNFTNSAEKRNAENLLILRSPYAMKRYLENWQIHWGHSVSDEVEPLGHAARRR
jgi:phosphatidylserine/phosphatidylglycerophosphate/cardiolipin synthase-like enzyme